MVEVPLDLLDYHSLEGLIGRLGTLRQDIRNWITTHLQVVPHDTSRKRLEVGVFTQVLEVVVKRWTIPILWEIEVHGGLHFNELHRNVTGISSRTLSDRLKDLEAQCIVQRTTETTRPPKVFYQLTDKGKGVVELSLLVVVHLLQPLAK